MKIYQGKELPKLAEPQCSVIQAEVWTGKILTLDGKRLDIRSEAAYILIFDNLEEAKKYAEEKVIEFPDIECHIYDHFGKQVKRIFKEGHKRTVIKPRNNWWKFWEWKFR
jgi:hypothetical protein